MTLPSEILAFKLIRKANITKEEKLLVLTGMNYDNKGTLYEEAKKSLKKFKGVIAAAVLPLSLSQHLSLTMKRPSLLHDMAGGKEGSRVEAIGMKAGSVGDQGEGVRWSSIFR